MSLNTISIEQLLQTPVCMMTGEQLAFLMNNLSFLSERKESASPVPTSDRKQLDGVMFEFAPAKKSGIIDKAITQVGRKIVVDVELALQLAHGYCKSNPTNS